MQAPDWVDGTRALKIVSSFVDSQGSTFLTQARLSDTPDKANDNAPGKILLAGFTAFDSHDNVNVYDWCLPRASIAYDDLVGLYEEYVDRPLGTMACPERVLRSAWPPGRSEALFGITPRPAAHWWTPMAWLILALARSRGGTVDVNETWLKLQQTGCSFEVDFNYCYSNSTGKFRKYANPAEDAGVDGLTVPLLITSHPLALAVDQLAEGNLPTSVQWALNTAIRCEADGKIPRIGRNDLVKSAGPVKRNRAARLTDADLIAAVRLCREILADPDEDSLYGIYKVAVPALLSRADFVVVVGKGAGQTFKPLTDEQIESFAHFLELKEKNLLCRHVSAP